MLGRVILNPTLRLLEQKKVIGVISSYHTRRVKVRTLVYSPVVYRVYSDRIAMREQGLSKHC